MNNIIRYFLDILFFLITLASGIFAGAIFAFFIYTAQPGTSTFILATIVLLLGLAIGIFSARLLWKIRGSNELSGGVRASHDFDFFNSHSTKTTKDE